MREIKAKAMEELVKFLENNEEDKNNFIAKVDTTEGILTNDFEKGLEKEYNEVIVILLAKTPNGLQNAYTNVIAYDPEADKEEVFRLIEKAFPTKEEIVEAKAKAAEQEKARKEFEERMQNINPQELAAMMGEEAKDIVEEAVSEENKEK